MELNLEHRDKLSRALSYEPTSTLLIEMAVMLVKYGDLSLNQLEMIEYIIEKNNISTINAWED